jgi:four helix bundle protein
MASDHRFPFQRLDVYQVAFTLSRRVSEARVRDAELRDQVTRAVKSTFLNLCEGLPEDRPKVRAKYFRDADNSLHETVGAIDLAQALGAIDAHAATEIQALALRVRNMIRALRAPRP